MFAQIFGVLFEASEGQACFMRWTMVEHLLGSLSELPFCEMPSPTAQLIAHLVNLEQISMIASVLV